MAARSTGGGPRNGTARPAGGAGQAEGAGRARGEGQVARRAVLIGAAAAGLLPVAGCSGSSRPRPAGAGVPGRATVADRLAALEHRFRARLGVSARDTGSGAVIGYRADDRFPMCSTYKVLAAAAILHRDGTAGLARRVGYGKADLVPGSPITATHLGTGMTLGELCQAAVSDSDNTAANLLLAQLGGPAGVTGYARSLGDRVTRLDRTEPAVNEAAPGDVRDTTTPHALAADLEAIVLGTALSVAGRSLLTRWLVYSVTGTGRIRAGAPTGWTVGDKTGTGGYGTDNDIAILLPPRRAPIVLAIMSARADRAAPPSDALVAAATKVVLPAL